MNQLSGTNQGTLPPHVPILIPNLPTLTEIRPAVVSVNELNEIIKNVNAFIRDNKFFILSNLNPLKDSLSAVTRALKKAKRAPLPGQYSISTTKKELKRLKEGISRLEQWIRDNPPPPPPPSPRASRYNYLSLSPPTDISVLPDINRQIDEVRLGVGEIDEYNQTIQSDSLNLIERNYRFTTIKTFQEIADSFLNVYLKQTNVYKMNFSYGYVLEEHVEGDEETVPHYRTYIYSPFNQHVSMHLYQNLPVITNYPDFLQFMTDLGLGNGTVDVEEFTMNVQLANTRTRVLGIYEINIKVYPLGYQIGCSINVPDILNVNKSIITISEHNDYLCFFRCMAVHRGARRDRTTQSARDLFEKFYKHRNFDSYQGINLSEIERYQELFKVNINIYTICIENDTIVLKPKMRSISMHDTVASLGIWNDSGRSHFMYIKNIDTLNGVFKCRMCKVIFDTNRNLRRHEKETDCGKDCINRFPKFPIRFEAKKGVLEEIDHVSGKNRPLSCDPYIGFDIEALLRTIEPNGAQVDGEKTVFTRIHVPVSISLQSKLDPRPTTLMNNDPRELVREFMAILEEKSNHIRAINQSKYKPYYDDLDGYGNRCNGKYAQHAAKLRKKLDKWVNCVVIAGYNSGFYDLGVMRSLGLFDNFKPTENIKKNSRYMLLSDGKMQFRDIIFYLPANTKLSAYIKSFTGKDQKGLFPYDWFDNVDKLSLTEPPPIEAFYNHKEKEGISQELYESHILKVWRENSMNTFADFLKYYNEKDVTPFMEAIDNHYNWYVEKHGLDLFKSNLSLPGHAEQIMIKSATQILPLFEEALSTHIKSNPNSYRPQYEEVYEMLLKYKKEDKGKTLVLTSTLISDIWNRNHGYCAYCDTAITIGMKWEIDLVNDGKNYCMKNSVLCCYTCYGKRDNYFSYKHFRHEMVFEQFEKIYPQIYVLDESRSEIFNILKSGIVGGPSIVFHRYHESNITNICRSVYNEDTKYWEIGPVGDQVKKVVGFDANALYLWCIGNDMPCGVLELIDGTSLNLDSLLHDVSNDSAFGFFVVDAHVPEHLYNYFGEMCPFFINKDIDPINCGDFMKPFASDRKPARKLISTLKAEKCLVYQPVLKWYLKHGIVVTKIHHWIKAVRGTPFKSFMDWVTSERRKGDDDPSLVIHGNLAKDHGNSGFGRTIMDKSKHHNYKITNLSGCVKARNSNRFIDCNMLGDDTCEVIKSKKSVYQNLPIQVGSAIFQMAKLRMLEFHYDCIDKFLSRRSFQYTQMDTDSAGMALTSDPGKSYLPIELIKPEMREQWEKEKYDWFPDPSLKGDKRTPGKFKKEYQGNGIIALASKCYYCLPNELDDNAPKISAKGVQKRRNNDMLTFDNFKKVMTNGETIPAINVGFRLIKNESQIPEMLTYECTKTGLSTYYDKRRVLNDGITTAPITLS